MVEELKFWPPWKSLVCRFKMEQRCRQKGEVKLSASAVSNLPGCTQWSNEKME